jgi:hypothetical protein
MERKNFHQRFGKVKKREKPNTGLWRYECLAFQTIGGFTTPLGCFNLTAHLESVKIPSKHFFHYL